MKLNALALTVATAVKMKISEIEERLLSQLDFSQIKIVASDFDGTLINFTKLNDDNKNAAAYLGLPSAGVLEAIDAFQKSGGTFVVSTQRSRANALQLLTEPNMKGHTEEEQETRLQQARQAKVILPLRSRGGVYLNGAMVYDPNGTLVSKFPLGSDLVQRLLEFWEQEMATTEHKDINLLFTHIDDEQGNEVRFFPRHAKQNQIDETMRTIKLVKDDRETRVFDDYVFDPENVNAGVDLETAENEVARNALIEESDRLYLACFMGESLGEGTGDAQKELNEKLVAAGLPKGAGYKRMCFNHPDVDKRKGLELLLESAGSNRNDLVAVGDAMNDYPMFELAVQGGGFAIAMGNAAKAFKAKPAVSAVTSPVQDAGLKAVLDKAREESILEKILETMVMNESILDSILPPKESDESDEGLKPIRCNSGIVRALRNANALLDAPIEGSGTRSSDELETNKKRGV